MHTSEYLISLNPIRKSIIPTGYIWLFVSILLSLSQNTLAQDTLPALPKEINIKRGWSFGALPIIAYSTDIGVKYGGLVNLYDFGNGKEYPNYQHSIYMEISRTTKGGGVNQLLVDSRKLIPGVRTMIEASLFTEKALDFYGFNGYNAWYNEAFTDPDNSSYISRMFYRMERRNYKLRMEIFRKIGATPFRWFGGIEMMNIKLKTIDIHSLNRFLVRRDQLPDTALLYDDYIKWGVIPEKEKAGGITTQLKGGIIYDTRNEESNPMKGMWTELQLLAAPAFLSTHANYMRFVATQRQYFTIVPQRLSFVYRVSYQGKLAGTMPFYMLPFVYNTAPNYTRDALGGNHTIRGVMRNRIVGEDYVFANIELRWKFWITRFFNQNVYFALSGFLDGGMVTRPYKIDLSGVPAEYLNWFNHQKETPHTTYGGGVRTVLNDNFILAVDIGRPFNRADGDIGGYLFLSWLF